MLLTGIIGLPDPAHLFVSQKRNIEMIALLDSLLFSGRRCREALRSLRSVSCCLCGGHASGFSRCRGAWGRLSSEESKSLFCWKNENPLRNFSVSCRPMQVVHGGNRLFTWYFKTKVLCARLLRRGVRVTVCRRGEKQDASQRFDQDRGGAMCRMEKAGKFGRICKKTFVFNSRFLAMT